jgi:hypothetical protein
MKVSEVTSGRWEPFEVEYLDHKAIWFYGQPVPSGDDPRFSVTAWVSTNAGEFQKVVAAEAIDEEVEDLVERAKAGLIEQVTPHIEPATKVLVVDPDEQLYARGGYPEPPPSWDSF